jgi:hypothetical protein
MARQVGYKAGPEERLKISLAGKGRKPSEETKLKIKEGNLRYREKIRVMVALFNQSIKEN